ncbi:LysR family transcriptional regulator [Endozoicomonas sp. OPT23]|uniref:LysR family transcriptional regulator n=1 Tax=Endozoicomonas sp. OPT23 TaxID=2072845 RepID=UPI00129AE31F|nr:LysR family transcriptional regulator [Endozoicomonas sp. OPT23]MRI33536.1 LysR family transcriptional regulator [Endozoicomonas sp. OPT23]
MKYLRHMAVFASIVESGSITAAAEAEGLSKSVISQQLKDLEQALGVVLLNRTTRAHNLTPAGKDFYQQCRQITALGQQAWQQAQNNLENPRGPIRISAPQALIEPLVTPAIGQLIRKNPSIIPTILSEDHRTDLLQQDIDLAVRVGEMPDSDYIQKKLGSFREVLCAASSYVREHQIEIDQLPVSGHKNCQLDYIANSWQGSQPTHALLNRKSSDSIQLKFKANRFCNSLTTVVGMVRAGAGIALLPDFIFKPLQQQGLLIDLFPDYDLPEVPVYAVHAYGQSPSLLLKLSLETLKSKMDELAAALE